MTIKPLKTPIKRWAAIAAAVLLGISAWAVDLSFSDAPQATDSSTILEQREAVSLHRIATGAAAATSSSTKIVPLQIIKTVAATATPERASATTLKCTGFSITGVKARGTDNTGTVYFGWTSGNDTQLEALTAGQTRSMTAPAGTVYDLTDLYIDVATAADGVLITYNPPAA